MPEFREYGKALDLSALNTRSVDDTEVTDHHALITTGISPEGLSEAESAVYALIAGRMLEAFSPCCKKETLLMECRIGETVFRSKSSAVTSPGWRGVFGRKEGNQLLLLRKPSIKLLAEQGDGKQDERQAYDDDREKAKSFVGSHLNPPSCISRQITGFRPPAQGGS